MTSESGAPDSADGETSEKGGDYWDDPELCRWFLNGALSELEDAIDTAPPEIQGLLRSAIELVDHSKSDLPELATDGGLDAETVLGTVAPGDVVEVAGSPYRVVDVDAEEDEGVLRLYDLVERTETVKAAGAGDVDVYLHRSEDDAIRHRVDQERERRDAGDDQEEDPEEVEP